ncbi:MAG: hypothetical protein WB699_14335, partial [Bacteroidota bacterium]
ALALLVVLLVYEYRLRKPDQMVLFESHGTIGFRKMRWYPRHFSLALPGTTHLMELKFEANAKGSIPIIVKLTATVAASREAIGALIRVGGWNAMAVGKAAKELESVLLGQVKEHTEQYGLEELSSELLLKHLHAREDISRQKFGLDLISLSVQSIDPVDISIAEALHQRESARIMEQTEELNQRARVAAAQARLRADEQIARSEHQIEILRYELKNAEQQQESRLARQRVEDELLRNRMRLEFEREEMTILKENPQLLLLTPQAARLAEASQSMKNARTVVSLSPENADQGVRLAGLFQLFLEQILDGSRKTPDKKSKNAQ